MKEDCSESCLVVVVLLGLDEAAAVGAAYAVYALPNRLRARKSCDSMTRSLRVVTERWKQGGGTVKKP
jgi:hypothetical protein